MTEQELYEYTDKVQRLYGTSEVPRNSKETLEWFRQVREALKSRTPRKPTGKYEHPEEVGKIGYHNCAVCGEMVTRRFCPNCGQRVDWSEEDDGIQI